MCHAQLYRTSAQEDSRFQGAVRCPMALTAPVRNGTLDPGRLHLESRMLEIRPWNRHS